MKIGVVGFSRRHFDQKKARELLNEILIRLMKKYGKENSEIVSGLTNAGVPKIAYELAREYELTTVGISAKRALRVKSGVFPCDKRIIVGTDFGDESETFIDYIDILVRVGGGPQSRKEVEMFKQRKIDRYGDEIANYLIEHEVEWFGRR